MTPRPTVHRSKAELLALVGVLVLCVVVPLAPGRVTVGRLPLDAITLSVPLALLLALPFLRRLGARRIPSLLIEVPALAFLGVGLLTIAFSQDRAGSLLTWIRYATYLLLVLVTAALAIRPQNRRAITWTVTLTSLVTVGQAAYQYIAPGALVTSFGSTDIAARVTASFGNPNSYSEYLLLAFAFTLSLALAEKGARRWFAVAILVAQSCALVLTYTRGTWLALVLGVAIAAVLIDWRLAGVFVVGGVGLLAVVPGALERLTSVLSSEGGASVRLPLWRMAVEMFSLHPLTGVGLGEYLPALLRQIQLTPSMLPAGVLPFSAHNSYLTIAAETGVFGIASFGWLVVRAVRTCGVYATRLVRRTEAWVVNAALSAGVIGYAANALTDNSFQNPRAAVFFWVLLGVLCANGAAALKTAAGTESAEKKPSRLWAMPKTGGRLVLDSPVGKTLFGPGAQDVDATDDLAPWEPAGSAVANTPGAAR